MANETTTTSANDVTYGAIISPVVLATMAEQSLPMSWCREFDIIAEASNAVDVTSIDSIYGAADDDGAGVDTEYDAVEGTELTNTQVATSKVTLTSAEYGIAVEVTDNVQEDTISGIDLFEYIAGHMSRALALAWTDDFCALSVGLTTAVGTTTVDLTVAVMLSAQTGIRVAGVVADDGLAYLLDNEAVSNVEGELISTNAAAAIYASAADRLLAVSADPNNGMGAGRHVMGFRNYPVHATGLTDTVNAAADVSSMCFTPSGPRNDPYATFGNVIKRLPRFENERHAKKRTTDLVLTMRMAPGEINDASGTEIISDAP